MWVYQESSSKLTAPNRQEHPDVPRDEAKKVEPLPEDDQRSRFALSESTRKNNLELHPEKLPRNCVLLAGSYLFGSLLAGFMLDLCHTSELETLSAYLANWSNIFILNGPGSVWKLFRAEYLTIASGATVLLLLGLSALGTVPIHLFAMLFGLGIGMVQLQLFLQTGWKNTILALFFTGIPTAAAVTCLCLFGASALVVSGGLQKTAFGKKGYCSGSGARRLAGQYLVLNVLFAPICGVSTALVCLFHQLSMVSG